MHIHVYRVTMYNVVFTVAFGTRSLKVTALVYSLGWGVFSALAGSSYLFSRLLFSPQTFLSQSRYLLVALLVGLGAQDTF